MTHSMRLQPSPFEKIKNGTKTIELRLFDDKRRRIRIGDTIVFTDTESGEKLKVKVLRLSVFDSFEKMYKALPLLECGYTKNNIDTASPDDMAAYYPKEMQEKYGVIGIKISLL